MVHTFPDAAQQSAGPCSLHSRARQKPGYNRTDPVVKPVRTCTGLEFGDTEEVNQVGIEPVVAKVEYGQEADSHHHPDRTPGEEQA